MAKIEKGPPGEYMLADTEVRDSIPPGDWETEGGSEWRKDAGEEGGAAKGNGILGACVEPTVAAVTSAPEGVLTGTRTACPMRFWFLRCPKHQYMLNQLPQVFF